MFKSFFKDKGIGYFVTLGVMLLTLILSIVYLAGIKSNEALTPQEFSTAVFLLVLFGFIGALIMLGVPLILHLAVKTKAPWYPELSKTLTLVTPWYLLAFDLLAFLLFANTAYKILSRLATGRSPMETFNVSGLLFPIVFFLITLIAGVVGVFMPMYKKSAGAAESVQPAAEVSE